MTVAIQLLAFLQEGLYRLDRKSHSDPKQSLRLGASNVRYWIAKQT